MDKKECQFLCDNLLVNKVSNLNYDNFFLHGIERRFIPFFIPFEFLKCT